MSRRDAKYMSRLFLVVVLVNELLAKKKTKKIITNIVQEENIQLMCIMRILHHLTVIAFEK